MTEEKVLKNVAKVSTENFMKRINWFTLLCQKQNRKITHLLLRFSWSFVESEQNQNTNQSIFCHAVIIT